MYSWEGDVRLTDDGPPVRCRLELAAGKVQCFLRSPCSAWVPVSESAERTIIVRVLERSLAGRLREDRRRLRDRERRALASEVRRVADQIHAGTMASWPVTSEQRRQVRIELLALSGRIAGCGCDYDSEAWCTRCEGLPACACHGDRTSPAPPAAQDRAPVCHLRYHPGWHLGDTWTDRKAWAYEPNKCQACAAELLKENEPPLARELADIREAALAKVAPAQVCNLSGCEHEARQHTDRGTACAVEGCLCGAFCDPAGEEVPQALPVDASELARLRLVEACAQPFAVWFGVADADNAKFDALRAALALPQSDDPVAMLARLRAIDRAAQFLVSVIGLHPEGEAKLAPMRAALKRGTA